MAEVQAVYCANDAHRWRSSYYGHQCELCPLFYPFGSAPWESDFDDDEEESNVSSEATGS